NCQPMTKLRQRPRTRLGFSHKRGPVSRAMQTFAVDFVRTFSVLSRYSIARRRTVPSGTFDAVDVSCTREIFGSVNRVSRAARDARGLNVFLCLNPAHRAFRSAPSSYSSNI